jgi:hypothetical protein
MSVDMAEYCPSSGAADLVFSAKEKKSVKTLGVVHQDCRFLAGDILDGRICSVWY